MRPSSSAPGARDGDAGEVAGEAVERVDHPHAGEQPPRQASTAASGRTRVEQRLGAAGAAGRRDSGARPRPRAARCAPLLARGVEQALAGGEIVHHAGGQARAQRRGQRQLVAGLHVKALGQRARRRRAAPRRRARTG